jgi:phenylpropionate dioxygenase-like ring-hydroxylating dioxygenase large terminal subunit
MIKTTSRVDGTETTMDEDTPFQVLRRTWQPVALSRDLAAGAIRTTVLLGEEIALWRGASGQVGAVVNRCPHRGARFGIGCVEGDEIRCPYHGWRFDTGGRCTAIPSLGEGPPAKPFAIAGFATAERYGFVWILLDGPAIAPIPDIPEFESASWDYVVAAPMDFASGFRREIENYLDMSHFAFAHARSLGRAAGTLIERYEIHEQEDGFRMEAAFPALSGGGAGLSRLQAGHHRTQICHLPNVTTIRQQWPDGHARVLVHVPSPITPTSCRVFWSLAISPGFDGPSPEEQLAFAYGVLDEDRRMCENQVPAEVPLALERCRLVPADRLAVTFRKRFRSFCARHASVPQS